MCNCVCNVYILYSMCFGYGLGASWFLDSVSVTDPTKEEVYEFICNKWLSVKSDDKMTKRMLEISASRKQELSKFIPCLYTVYGSFCRWSSKNQSIYSPTL